MGIRIILYIVLATILMLVSVLHTDLPRFQFIIPYKETCLGLRLIFHVSVYSRYKVEVTHWKRLTSHKTCNLVQG